MITQKDTERIHSKNDLLKFFELLLKDFQENNERWTNDDVSSYLEAFGAWLTDSEGYYQNSGKKYPEISSWREIGDALVAARIY